MNFAVQGMYDPTVIGFMGERLNRVVAMDFGIGLSRPTRQRLTKLGWIDVTIQRIPKGAHQIMRGDQRMPPFARLGIDDLQVDRHTLRHGNEMVIAVEMPSFRCQPETARGVVIVDRVVGVVGEFLVEFDRVGFQADHGLVGTEVRDVCGGMPSGA